jgi:hypothetical protein
MIVDERMGLSAGEPLHKLATWLEDRELLDLVARCIDAQRRAAKEYYESRFKPDPHALDAVSEETLREILAGGGHVHGISANRSISNVIVFNTRTVADAVTSREVNELRQRVDRAIARKLRGFIGDDIKLDVSYSGHFWYPPGGYMSWHTNNKKPGIRVYITYAETPGESFFRYRDPATDEIVTCRDDRWNVTTFRVSPERTFWHAVYSNTHRFSVGYLVRPFKLKDWVYRKVRPYLPQRGERTGA